jgi:hypothetical protein
MLFYLFIPAGWLGILFVLTAVCRTAAAGDAAQPLDAAVAMRLGRRFAGAETIIAATEPAMRASRTRRGAFCGSPAGSPRERLRLREASRHGRRH